MGWQKKGLIFRPGQHPGTWAKSHACVPTAYHLNEATIRIFFSPRNAEGQSIPTFLDVDARDPSKVKYVHEKPIMTLGERGTFDDGGIMPCCIVPVGDDLFLYYVGWNPSVSVPYRNAIGLAISRDRGMSFQKVVPGAIVDRSMHEPFFTASPWVMREKEDVWHMWYASSTGFVKVDDSYEPLYIIKYARSKDGIHWSRDNITCIPPRHKEEANARATVLKDGEIYKMWYAYRGSRDFRDGADAYQIGYAQSRDAVHWKRLDEKAGISYSDKGWDSSMQTYPCVLESFGRRLLFYNGNGFGKTGIGWAVWQDDD
jgi:predicted GH43/DUF377 family glycosyl hydrolase